MNLLGQKVNGEARNRLWWLGLIGVLLPLQIATGSILLMAYHPNTEQAFESVHTIMWAIPFGYLFRRLHQFGATFIIIWGLLYVTSLLLKGRYKGHGKWTWVSGFLLLPLLMTQGFTGYLLPWTQVSFWGATIGTSYVGQVPFLGEALLNLARGGDIVGGGTLSRFFAIHVVILPLAILILLALHGGLTMNASKALGGEEDTPLFKVLLGWGRRGYFLVAALLALTLWGPEFIESPANPLVTPPTVKPEWYFLPIYQSMKLLPNEFIGLMLQGLGFGALISLPFWDRGIERDWHQRPLFTAIVLLSCAGLIGMGVWGALS